MKVWILVCMLHVLLSKIDFLMLIYNIMKLFEQYIRMFNVDFDSLSPEKQFELLMWCIGEEDRLLQIAKNRDKKLTNLLNGQTKR